MFNAAATSQTPWCRLVFPPSVSFTQTHWLQCLYISPDSWFGCICDHKSKQTHTQSMWVTGDTKSNKLSSICCILPPLPHPSLLFCLYLNHPHHHLHPLCSDVAHLPRVCPFQQRSSFVTSAAIFSSLQMVCGRDTQEPRMGRSRSFSSVTCEEVEGNLLWVRLGFKVSWFL